MSQSYEGEIVSFDWDKGFGFIKTDSESFFFHKSSFQTGVTASDILIGDYYSFELHPGKQGMVARNLTASTRIKCLRAAESFIFTKKKDPQKGDVLIRTEVTSKMFKSPDDAKTHLQNAAKFAGCNSLLNLSYIKDTFSSGNYQYTVHGYKADLALVVIPFFTKNEEEFEINLKEIESLKVKVTSASNRQQAILEEERTQQYNKGCFIATAIYGDQDCPEVWEFRQYRDVYLRKRILGRLFIKLYYKVSPSLSKYLSKSDVLIGFIRIVLDYILTRIR
jgi:cold shock CspA family protein